MPLTASLVIGGISALGKTGVGIGQLIHGNKLAKNNKRPTFDIQDEYFENRDIAGRMAQRGLSDKALDYYTTENERALGATTGALLQAGGGINSLVAAYDNFQRGASEIAAKDAELQNKNILFYMDRNDAVAKQKVQKWVIDKYEPFKDTAAAASQEKVAGVNNLFTGLSEGAGTLAAYSQATNFDDLMTSMASRGAGGTTPATAGRTNPNPTYDNMSPYEDPYEVVVRPPATQTSTESVAQNTVEQPNGLTADDLEALKSIMFKLKI